MNKPRPLSTMHSCNISGETEFSDQPKNEQHVRKIMVMQGDNIPFFVCSALNVRESEVCV